MTGCALGLALKTRHRTTRKWPTLCCLLSVYVTETSKRPFSNNKTTQDQSRILCLCFGIQSDIGTIMVEISVIKSSIKLTPVSDIITLLKLYH